MISYILYINNKENEIGFACVFPISRREYIISSYLVDNNCRYYDKKSYLCTIRFFKDNKKENTFINNTHIL